jgi:hypothetical protein
MSTFGASFLRAAALAGTLAATPVAADEPSLESAFGKLGDVLTRMDDALNGAAHDLDQIDLNAPVKDSTRKFGHALDDMVTRMKGQPASNEGTPPVASQPVTPDLIKHDEAIETVAAQNNQPGTPLVLRLDKPTSGELEKDFAKTAGNVLQSGQIVQSLTRSDGAVSVDLISQAQALGRPVLAVDQQREEGLYIDPENQTVTVFNIKTTASGTTLPFPVSTVQQQDGGQAALLDHNGQDAGTIRETNMALAFAYTDAGLSETVRSSSPIIAAPARGPSI